MCARRVRVRSMLRGKRAVEPMGGDGRRFNSNVDFFLALAESVGGCSHSPSPFTFFVLFSWRLQSSHTICYLLHPSRCVSVCVCLCWQHLFFGAFQSARLVGFMRCLHVDDDLKGPRREAVKEMRGQVLGQPVGQSGHIRGFPSCVVRLWN